MVFVLRDLEGYGVKDVCRILKMSENRVKSNLYHARSRIREGLKEMGYFGGDNDL
jgi:DNA-directed RNA polymerase specialized sigma24 family protein